MKVIIRLLVVLTKKLVSEYSITSEEVSGITDIFTVSHFLHNLLKLPGVLFIFTIDVCVFTTLPPQRSG